MQVPSNLIVSKIQYPGIYICCAVALWGMVSACTAVVHSFGGLLACRKFIHCLISYIIDTLSWFSGFMLGFVEAAFFPGAFYYLSMFYNRRQIAFRTAILYSGSQLGNAFGTLLAIAITKLDGVHGIAGWRWYVLSPFFFPLPNLLANIR